MKHKELNFNKDWTIVAEEVASRHRNDEIV